MFDRKKLFQCYEAPKNHKNHQYKPSSSRKSSKITNNNKQTAIRHLISNQTIENQKDVQKKCENTPQQGKNEQFKFKDVKNQYQEASQFKVMTKKLFDYLDIEKKCYLDKMCLNLKIPNSILYFFGSIFQLIKQQNKQINAQQFWNECSQIHKKLSQEQVYTFFEDMKKFSLHTGCSNTFSFSAKKRSNSQDKKPNQIDLSKQTCNKLKNSLRRSNYKNQQHFMIPKQQARKSDNYRNMMNKKQNEINKLKFQPNSARDNKNDISTYTFYPVQPSNRVQLKLLSQIDQNKPYTQRKVSIQSSKNNEGKIDELTLKIQDYIKKNAHRLEISKGLRKNIMGQAII